MELSLNNRKLTLIILIALGAALRIWGIELNSLWNDELFSVAVSDPDNSFNYVFKTTVEDVHPPFYQLFLWAIHKVFGFGEFTGRYLSALLGIIHIPIIYILGKKIFDQRVGLVAAFLLTINFLYIWFSQETRSYELLSLLTTLSFIFYIDTQNNKKYSFFYYALTLILLLNTHFFGFLPALAQAILILLNRKYIIKYITVAVSAIISLIPLVISIIDNLSRQSFWIKEPSAYFFYSYFRQYFGEAILSNLMFLFVIMGIVLLIKKNAKKEMSILFLWIAVGLILPYLKSILSAPILTSRNTIVIMPAYLILISYTICSLKYKKFSQIVLVLISGLSFYYFVINKKLYRNSDLKQKWRAIVELTISDHVDSSIPLLSTKKMEFDTYFKLLNSNIRVTQIESIADIAKLNYESFYLLYGHQYIFSVQDIEANTDYKLVDEVSFDKIGRRLFQLRKGSNLL